MINNEQFVYTDSDNSSVLSNKSRKALNRSSIDGGQFWISSRDHTITTSLSTPSCPFEMIEPQQKSSAVTSKSVKPKKKILKKNKSKAHNLQHEFIKK